MSNFEENFQLFQRIGFSPNPSQGQLDSDIWSLIGFTDGNVAFGGVAESGSFAHGNSSGGVSTGGVYSFQIASSALRDNVKRGLTLESTSVLGMRSPKISMNL